jgi:hypothetical protein
MYVFTRGNLYRLRFSFAFGLHFAGRTSGRWINSEILLCDVASGTSLPEKTEQPSLGSRVKSSCVQSRISRGIGGEELKENQRKEISQYPTLSALQVGGLNIGYFVF